MIYIWDRWRADTQLAPSVQFVHCDRPSHQHQLIRQVYTDEYTQTSLHRQVYADEFTQTSILKQVYTDEYTQTSQHRQVYTEKYTQTSVLKQLYTASTHRQEYTDETTQEDEENKPLHCLPLNKNITLFWASLNCDNQLVDVADMSGDFCSLLKEQREKEAKAVLRGAGGDIGLVSYTGCI